MASVADYCQHPLGRPVLHTNNSILMVHTPRLIFLLRLFYFSYRTIDTKIHKQETFELATSLSNLFNNGAY